MSAIKTVAIAGASGDLGSHVFKKFVASDFTIRVLKRAGSESTFPEGTDVVEVDYASVESLTAALKGQDAVVSTLTTLAAGAQDTLIEAALAAGVKRFIPSEFGSNLDIPSVRALPLFSSKVAIQEKLKALAKEDKITYTFVYNSVFLDWGLAHNFFIDFSKSEATLIDGGNAEFSTTTLSSVADAVVGVVSHPEETKNRVVYIQDTVLTQKKVLELAKKANPNKTWTVKEAVLDDLINTANERLAKGLLDWETFGAYLYRAIYDPTSVPKFPKLDNELLGLKGKTDEEVYELIKAAAQ
ncbi:uncharacterized protein NECHADRAFT_50491 [Fusarium vanettenii 77-13-4]|uniref:NmrA-like domain-containing protein n=1 Tax=Fusarium vanettenii (strain ATCC MYA-4622 / CBS 123669 / FGSC 9596 / NRRL 45880 / 77-13-4) TaxID=660122 RepID=C7ZP86_FUSV7|nr:uncharacterized protein NECHADRAFT_50491 [Fusarium vanettenii 77-13-4]EEU34304.1 hypothetical protein NECHADRAFT_50491 [Fusarium vanettenii 77-13-4]